MFLKRTGLALQQGVVIEGLQDLWQLILETVILELMHKGMLILKLMNVLEHINMELLMVLLLLDLLRDKFP